MTIQRKHLPDIPYGVKAKLLAPNLKLFSNQEIADIKARFTQNGRYHHYVDEDGSVKKLKYTLFVHDGRYLAVYPGKNYLMAPFDANFGQVKVAQDLDSGEWVVDKVMYVHPSNDELVGEDILGEVQALMVNQQAIVNQNGRPAFFHRPFMGEPTYFGKPLGAEDGKYDVFMKFASGMDFAEWMRCCANLPPIVKMDMSIGLVTSLMSVHQNEMLHRDVKLRNAVFDLFQNETKLVDFGFAEPFKNLSDDKPAGCGTPGYIAPEISGDLKSPAKYSLKSDIYALGATLGVLWGFYEITGAKLQACNNAHFTGDFALKRDLQRLLEVMLHATAQVRPELEDVLIVLQRMKDALPEANRVLRGGVLDVSTWRDACLHDDKKALLRKLKTFDYIQLADREGTCSEYELLTIKRSLQNNICITAGDVLLGTQKEIEDYAAQTKNHVQEDGRIYRLNKVEYTARLRMIAENQLDEPLQEVEDSAEEYSLSECLTWFFGALRDDIASLMPTDAPQISANIGCFGLFNCGTEPGIGGTDANPFYETEEEAYRDALAMSRY